MASWVVQEGENKRCFDSFRKAVTAFKKRLSLYMTSWPDIFDNTCIPFAVGAFLSGKCDLEIEATQELLINSKLTALLPLLVVPYEKEWVTTVEEWVEEDIHYESAIPDFQETLRIDVEIKEDEIIAELFHKGPELTFFKTNAFRFKDPAKPYYFCSHQIVTTSKDVFQLGRVADLDLSLKKE
ncbi:MAG: hypothetical protein K6E59_02250 [Bacilli bacterium]|nr:hypothetical protein [Bacilli bacterium]